MKKYLLFAALLFCACDDAPDARDALDGSYELARFNHSALPANAGEQLPGDTLYITSGMLEIHNRRYVLTVRWRIGQQFETGWSEVGSVIVRNSIVRLDPDLPARTEKLIVHTDSLVRVTDVDDYDFRRVTSTSQ